MVAFDGDVVLQGLVDVIMGYVIKHKEILDQAVCMYPNYFLGVLSLFIGGKIERYRGLVERLLG